MKFPSLKSAAPISQFLVGEQSLKVVSTRRKNSIALKERADGVVILVPNHLSNRRLMNLLNSHHSWLQGALSRMQQRQLNKPKPSVFKAEQGEWLELLGESYQLSIHLESATSSSSVPQSQPAVLIEASYCYVHLPTPKKLGPKQTEIRVDKNQSTQVSKLITTFMQQQAQTYLLPKLEIYALQIGVEFKSLTIKGYKSRWGSCYSDGRIQFNWRLMQAPLWVVDYVVVHELCHLVHANHSKDFWDLVTLHYPQTAEAKAYIKKHGTRWIQLLQ